METAVSVGDTVADAETDGDTDVEADAETDGVTDVEADTD